MRHLPSLVLLLFITACATPLRLSIPSLRFDSPELDGEDRKFSVALGLQSYNDAELSSDMNSVPVHTESTQFLQQFISSKNKTIFDAFDISYMYAKLSYAFSIPLEITYRLPNRFALKYQILGPRADTAKAHDFSLALSTSYSQSHSESYTKKFDTIPNNLSSIDVSRNLIDFALILGYRVGPKWLLYGGPFTMFSPYEVQQKLFASSDQHHIKGQLKNFGANLGLQYRTENGFAIKLEAVLSQLRGHNAQKHFVNGGLAISKAF